MATYLDGNVRKATANTVKAMQRSAENRRCPKCGRKSALKRYDGGDGIGRYCRWDGCGWSRIKFDWSDDYIETA